MAVRLRQTALPRCPKHPSIPAVCCGCGSHKPTCYKPHVERLKTEATIHAEATLSTEVGTITICGACGALAADHESANKADCRERTAMLLTFIRTNLCKHCGVNLNDVKGLPCDANPNGTTHDRRYLPRSKKVSACRECAAVGTIKVTEVEFQAQPKCFVEVWRQAIKERMAS